jgi:hypothetical protein
MEGTGHAHPPTFDPRFARSLRDLWHRGLSGLREGRALPINDGDVAKPRAFIGFERAFECGGRDCASLSREIRCERGEK